jgi:hypothetical protein
MDSTSRISEWQEGEVDRTKQYFELRFGSAEDGEWSEWMPAALVGPPAAGVVMVQFLVEPGDPKYGDVVGDAVKEIQYFLIDKNEDDPWSYAKYHCGTAANVYSQIHWSFYEPGKGKP